jgi:sugar/nucleoside kinase (ribokinase family)
VLVHNVSGKRTIIHHRGVQTRFDLEIPTIDFSETYFLHLDGYWMNTALQLATQAKKQGITVTLDPSSKLLEEPSAEHLFRLVDYFIPGYAFAKRFTGESEPWKAAEKLLQYGGKAVILTKGDEGCFIATQDERFHLPAFHVSVVDTTGAGDTFHGAFVAGLSKGYELRQAVQFASAVAALKCTKLGGQTGIPTFQETQMFLENQGITL